MLETIGMVLGSSVVTCFITVLFNWAQNRKNNSLNYITEERKKWREKIRSIAADIEKCKYRGEGEKNISQYLLQLEMNINPYGRGNQFDYEQDGHLWQIMEDIREVDNSKEFEKSKNLLLGYVSVLLKEDWERSKKEVKGYTNIIRCIMLEVIVSVIYIFFQIYILKVEDFLLCVSILFLNLSPIFLCKFFVVDELDLIETDSNRKVSIDNWFIRNKKLKKIVIRLIGYFLVFWGISVLMITQLYPRIIAKQIVCKDNNDLLYVYTKLNTAIWKDLDEEIEEYVKKDVVIINDNCEIMVQKNEHEEVILEVLKKYIKRWESIVIAAVCVKFIIEFNFLFITFFQSKKGMREVNLLKKKILLDFDVICEKLQRVIEELDSPIGKTENLYKDYFDIIYKLLVDAEEVLQFEISKHKYNIKTIETYKMVRIKKELEKDVKGILSDIRKIYRIKNCTEQKEMYEQIKEDISKNILRNLN